MTTGRAGQLIGLVVAASLVASPAHGDDGIEALLQTVEQRISANQIMSPEGGSALDAWKQVLEILPKTDPNRARVALAHFAVHLRHRANDILQSGDASLSAAISIFASQAEELETQREPLAKEGPVPETPGGATQVTVAPAKPTVATTFIGTPQAVSDPSRLYDLPQPSPGLRPHAARRKGHALASARIIRQLLY